VGVEVTEIVVHDGAAAGVRTREGEVRSEHVVVAGGAWSAAIAGAEAPPVRPVKGQILEFRLPAGAPALAGRVVRSPRCYLVSRADGRVVLGATMEERGFDTAVTGGGLYELLEAARELLPAVDELELIGAHAGLRPGTPDNLPVVGSAAEGLIWATGHHRNGVLQAPLTAAAVAGLLAGEPAPAGLERCSPARFAPARAGDATMRIG
jgi:glycine oxidase